MENLTTTSMQTTHLESGVNGYQRHHAGRLNMESPESPEKSKKNSAQSTLNVPMSNTVMEPLKTVAIASVSSVAKTVQPVEHQDVTPLPLRPLDSKEPTNLSLAMSMERRPYALREPAEPLPRNVPVKDYLVDGCFCEGYACAGKCYRSSPCSEPIWEAKARIKAQMEAEYERNRQERENPKNTQDEGCKDSG